MRRKGGLIGIVIWMFNYDNFCNDFIILFIEAVIGKLKMHFRYYLMQDWKADDVARANGQIQMSFWSRRASVGSGVARASAETAPPRNRTLQFRGDSRIGGYRIAVSAGVSRVSRITTTTFTRERGRETWDSVIRHWSEPTRPDQIRSSQKITFPRSFSSAKIHFHARL